MRRSRLFGALGALVLLVAASSAFAQAADPTDSVLGAIQAAMEGAAAGLYEKVYTWLGAFVMLQMIISGVKKLTDDGADLGSVVNLATRSVVSAGICLYLINNGPEFINSVGQMFLRDAVAQAPSVQNILAATMGLCGGLIAAMATIGVVSSAIASVVGYILMAVLAIGLYMATKFFMLQLELGMVVMLAPFNFSLLGLQQLREQGIAPFKSLLALIYRIILAGIILGAFSAILSNAGTTIKGLDFTIAANVGKAVSTVFYSLIGIPILAFLMFKSDSIAAQLAAGSSGMSVGDVAGAAVAAGAAGAAIAASSAAAGGAASKPAASMGDFLKEAFGGLQGSVTNAADRMGSGEPPPLPKSGGQASLSMGGPSGGSPAGAGGPTSSTMDPTKPQPAQADEFPIAGSYGGSAGPDMNDPEAIAAYRHKTGLDQGSGQTASISGASGGQGGLEHQLGRLADQMEQEQARKNKKPGLRETLGEANRHLEKEQATVGVSINTHHHD